MYRNIIFNKKNGEHSYITYQLDYLTEKESYMSYIIPVLREEYGLGLSFDEKTEALSDEKKEIVKNLFQKFNVPNPLVNPLKNGKTHLKPTRSKIGEIMAKDILTKEMDVQFAGRVSLEEDDSDVPKRGVDNFGFIFREINGDIQLDRVVVCEVKASEDKKSPPDVVEKNNDSLYKELLRLSNFDDRLMKALCKAFDRFDLPKYTSLIASLMYDIEKNDDLTETKKKVTIVPFLLRTIKTYNDKDFGKFYSNPSEFAGSIIKYYIVVIDTPIDQFADEIYSRVRGENE